MLDGTRKGLSISFLIIVCISLFIRLIVPVLTNFLVIDKPLPHADALVMMAGSYSERLPVVAQLYKDGVAPKILLTNDGIFSSWSEEKQRNLYEVEWAEYKLMKMNVPEKAIVKLTYSSSGSLHDALNTRKFVLDKGLQSLVIVTSDYHTKRSLRTFERVFQGYPVKIGVYPAKSEVLLKPVYKQFILLSYEMVKLVFFEIRCTFGLIS